MNRKELMKREFAKTLLRLSLEKPLEGITVSELAKECGVSRGTFYNHFFDIYDLINWIFEMEVSGPLQRYIETHDKSWSGITQQCLEKMYQRKTFLTAGENLLKATWEQRRRLTPICLTFMNVLLPMRWRIWSLTGH